MSNKRTALIGIGVPLLFALLLLMAAPAAAHHKSGHERGGGKSAGTGKSSSSKSGVTEDNDKNDNGTPNNVVDGGDNKHPSGKDKSVEPGNSGNQGNSSSDPDDDGRGPDRSNGGPDKPGGSGGEDLADQDGNNGCGNDDDFEDDNEGWCGRNPKAKGKSDARVKGQVREKKEKTVGTEVKGERVSKDEKVCVEDSSMAGVVCDIVSDALELEESSGGGSGKDSLAATEVLGERISRPASGLPTTTVAAGAESAERADRAERATATMPFTGSGVAKLLIVAAALVIFGALMLKARRQT